MRHGLWLHGTIESNIDFLSIHVAFKIPQHKHPVGVQRYFQRQPQHLHLRIKCAITIKALALAKQ